jgi:O-antigen/teichoic acid export membrane protein
MMGLLIFTAALRLPAAPFDVGFFVRQKFILQNFISIGCTLFRIGLLFVLLFCVSTRVLWVTTASVAMEFLLLVVSVPISMRLVPALRFRPSLIQWSIAREITSFGGWQFFMVLGISIRNALDPLVLNKFARAEDVACYNLASVPFQQLWTIVAMAKRVVNPSLIAMHAGGDHHRLQSTFLRGNRIALWAYLMPGLPLTLFAHSLIELYVGPRFWMTAGLIQINFFAFLVLVPAMIYSSISEAMGNPRNFCLLVLGTNLLNLVLTFVLVGWLQWGALGSSVASAVAPALCYPLFVWPMSRRALDIGARDWYLEVLWPGVIPALLATPFYLGAALVFGVHSVPGLFVTLALGCIAYVTFLYLFAARRADREDFARVIAAARTRAGFGQS